MSPMIDIEVKLLLKTGGSPIIFSNEGQTIRVITSYGGSKFVKSCNTSKISRESAENCIKRKREACRKGW